MPYSSILSDLFSHNNVDDVHSICCCCCCCWSTSVNDSENYTTQKYQQAAHLSIGSNSRAIGSSKCSRQITEGKVKTTKEKKSDLSSPSILLVLVIGSGTCVGGPLLLWYDFRALAASIHCRFS